MASRTRIPKAELTGIHGAMVKRMSRRMLGDVAEPAEEMWHNRRVLNFSFGLGRRAKLSASLLEALGPAHGPRDARAGRACGLRIVPRPAAARCGPPPSVRAARPRVGVLGARSHLRIRNPHKLGRLEEVGELRRLRSAYGEPERSDATSEVHG